MKENGTMQAYCVKCKEKRDITNPREVLLKNGRPATRGACGVCGTAVFSLGRIQ